MTDYIIVPNFFYMIVQFINLFSREITTFPINGGLLKLY